jgi:hypothetical protein
MAKPIFGNIELKHQGEIRFADADNSHYAALRASATLAGSITWTLPTADVAGFLKSNGSGVLSLQALTSADVSDFTEAAQDAVAAMFNDGDLDFTYNDGGDSFTAVLAPAAITGKSAATVAAGDLLLIADVSDSDNLKKVTASSVAALALGAASFKATWVDTDGATKVITHSLASTDLIVQIFDVATGESILVDSEVRTDVNTLTLTAAGIVPPATGWRVLILAI